MAYKMYSVKLYLPFLWTKFSKVVDYNELGVLSLCD